MVELSPVTPLSSEQDAWERLAAILAGRIEGMSDSREMARVTDGWAKLSVTLDGPKFHGTITPPVMESLLALQAAINRIYALTSHGAENARLLTDVEKSRVEIQAKVTEGTTTVTVDGTEVIKHIVDVLGASMTGEQLTLIAISIALLFFGTSAFRAYLSTKAAIRDKEIGVQEKMALSEQIGALSEQETARAKIMADAMMREPRIVIIKNEAEKVYDSVLKSASDANSAKIQGFAIRGEAANDLISASRSTSRITMVSGIYKIIHADANLEDGFRFRLRNIETGQTLVAGLRDALMFEEQGNIIQKAFFNRRLVRITLEAKMLRGVIRDAAVVAAEMLPESVPVDDGDVEPGAPLRASESQVD